MEITTGPKVTETAMVRDGKIRWSDLDMCNPESYFIAVFEKILFLTEKLGVGLLKEYFGKPVPETWLNVLVSLEGGKRKLVYIRRGSIIFICPAQESFQEITIGICTKKLAQRIAALLEVLGNI